jgi:hypothetical protein
MRVLVLVRTWLGEVIKIESCLVLVVVGVAAVVGGVIVAGVVEMLV